MKKRTRSQISRSNRLGGAKFERDVRKFIMKLGFKVSERRAQYRGATTDGCELLIEDTICVEAKRHKDIDLGTKKLDMACVQAMTDSREHLLKTGNFADGEEPRLLPWCVIWKKTGGRQMMLTTHNEQGKRITFDTSAGIASWIQGQIDDRK